MKLNTINKDIINIIKNYIIFKPKNKDELQKVVNLWCENKENALKLHGHIYNWNTSLITNMDYLFYYKTNFFTQNYPKLLCSVTFSIFHIMMKIFGRLKTHFSHGSTHFKIFIISKTIIHDVN